MLSQEFKKGKERRSVCRRIRGEGKEEGNIIVFLELYPQIILNLLKTN